jgi:threonine synthase
VSTVIQPDGTTARFPGMLSPREGEDGRVAFHYDYSPHLIPVAQVAPEGMWRYRHLLPLGDGPIHYPLRVGDTPLVAPQRLREVSGTPRLWLKDETRSPTGSNKDRATALVLEHAMREGVEVVSCASTGNVAVSLAVGAAAAGVRAVIFVPAGVSQAKLTVMLLAGATVIQVTEGYDAAFRLSRQSAAAFGWYDRNTGVNPLTLEAKKTVAFEIWEQLGRRFPDVVIVPVGDGPTLSAMVKGFRELRACGVADRLPRIVGVQAEGCQPLKRAWERSDGARPVRPDTIADGIAVGNPVSALMVLRDVRETGGGFVAVSDESLKEAITAIASTSGIIAEPAAAAAWAGLEPAVAAGFVNQDESVVVLITGTGLKTPQYLHPRRSAFTVHAKLYEVQEVLKGEPELAAQAC